MRFGNSLETKTQPTVTLKFGLFEADLARATLTRQGVRLKLQDQPFRILAMLLEQPGETVSRARLCEALWPRGTHVNFDGSLNAALKKLRGALQDDADNPRFIETVPRQGYRFLAPVQVVNGVNKLPPAQFLRLAQEIDSSPAPTDWDRQRAERTQRWFDAILLSAAILVGSWFLFFIVYPVPRPSVQRMSRITNAGRIDEWGGIVSDGTRIFFLQRDGGHWNLMQTSVEGGNAEKLVTPFENTRLFAISPDHSEFLIGQFSRRDDEMPLWLWPVQGGEPRRIGQAIGHDPAWSPDGTDIVFVRGHQLYAIRRDGTQLRELAHVHGNPGAPAWSPDGESIRFTLDPGEYGAQSVWEMAADGSGLHPMLSSGTQPSHQFTGNWTANGKYFLFSGCEHYDCNLWAVRDAWNWFRRSQHGPFPLTSGPDSLRVAIPAQTGSRIFAFSFHSHHELAQIDPRTQRLGTLALEANAEEVAISADGQMLAYVNRPDGSLWRSRADGSQRLRLTSIPLEASSPRWSPKGEQILFAGARNRGTRQIYVVSWDGGSLRPVLPKGWEGLNADWSPDGYRIVVTMHNEQIHPQYALFLLEPTTGVMQELPDSTDMTDPRCSPDGHYIAALDSSSRHLLVYNVNNAKWSPVSSGAYFQAPEWSLDGSFIYFQDQLDEQESVFRADVNTLRVDRVSGFADVLHSGALHSVFSGLGRDDSLFVTIERGSTDIYALDLDLP
jgi:Tol biopolymer transport system component/DNA-binding winged helix-turn-helix (wHTH) protein